MQNYSSDNKLGTKTMKNDDKAMFHQESSHSCNGIPLFIALMVVLFYYVFVYEKSLLVVYKIVKKFHPQYKWLLLL